LLSVIILQQCLLETSDDANRLNVQVTGAKVVTSAKNPGTKCFGLVTMSSAEEAELCIARLNKTEFHGRIISLEKVSGIYCYCCYSVSVVLSRKLGQESINS